MYAIVDIETTGSFPDQNGITEIAIVLFDGEKVERRFSSLINPGYPIPAFVAHLTGITDEMVQKAPAFDELASEIFDLLNQRIFVAHNVNFDYSFLKHHLKQCGFEWNARKLCTIKLSRKAFPGLPKYGLASLCKSLQVENKKRHRATGDADATTVIFEKIVKAGGEKLIREFLKKENREQILPPNLPSHEIKGLPKVPGVYYFHDQHNKVIYVGKAINLKKRIISHFTGLNPGRRRQEFLRRIYHISYKECQTELMAFLFESIEIKRLWPEFNYSQKKPVIKYGIYNFEDTRGFQRLAIDKNRVYPEPVLSFSLFSDAHRTLWKMVKEFQLHPALCFLGNSTIPEEEIPDLDSYNTKVYHAIETIRSKKKTFVIMDTPGYGSDFCCVLVVNGKFYGMGVMNNRNRIDDLDFLKQKLTVYPENETIQSMISVYAEKFPSKVIELK